MDFSNENFKQNIPQSIEAEKSVIGCMLQNTNTIDKAIALINENDFYSNTYKKIFEVIRDLQNEGINVDIITVRDKLISRGVDVNILTTDFFKDIIDSVPLSQNIIEYCDIIIEKSILRKAIEISENTIKDSLTNEKKSNDIIVTAQNDLFELSKTKNQKQYVKLQDVLPEVLNRIDIAAKTKDGITGIRTRFRDIDNLTAGLQPTDLIIIGARPSVGKTAFALNIAYNVAKDGKKIAFFSLEMGSEQLATRIVAMESKISSELLRSGRLSDNDFQNLIPSFDRLQPMNIIIDDTSSLTIAELKNKARKIQGEQGLDLIIIDYLQLMAGDVAIKSSNRQEEVARISRGLKGLAKELKIPVIALAQTGRSADERKNQKPLLVDLRESGAIEQDADIVIFIHREGKNNDEVEDKSKTEIIFAKHRNGRVGTVNLKFDERTTRYYDYVNG